MMNMATGDDSPLRQGAGIGSRLDLMDAEALQRQNSDLGLPQRVLEYLGFYRAKKGCGRPPRWAQPTWARLGAQVRPSGLCPPRGNPQVLLWPSLGVLVHKNSPRSFAVFGLHLILISCDVKNKQKQQLALGIGSIG